ncbi:putative ankyrin repeat domain-containing protein 27-like [Daphnia sinensis]|uniref:Ankyrin repeat domain-containing protein 27-like n=1 Tax=Daphnia sinensis TaxID=1820382 RepID=A0AAD5LAX5_9CRUS|nr:putative ankyrin repeat domain-containing protein 27-like [Daphnia sinensis]
MEYDEDLASNPFLKFFQENFTILYEEAVKNQWILCIPLANTVCHDQLDEFYIRQHIIMQVGEESRTLTNELVEISEDRLRVGSISVRILFQETIYTKLGRIKAFCINKEDPKISNIKSPTILQKKSIRDSIRTVKTALTHYLKADQNFAMPEKLNDCLVEVKNYISSLDRRISSCVVCNLYTQLMDLITIQASKADANLNKIRKNNYNTTLEDLNLPEQFQPSLAIALPELEKLPDQKLVADKLDCLRKSVTLLTKTDVPADLDADNLLALFSYLILKSQVTNWTAQLEFIKLFHTSSLLGEDGYLISTLEAVLDHLKQGSFDNMHSFPKVVPEMPLLRAASLGNTEALTELLYSSKFECHPLCSCRSCGLPRVVDALGSDSKGWTALHYATYYGHSDATQVLLRTHFRDQVQIADPQGRTALHWAAYRGFQTCLLLLCHQPGCDLNCRDCQGNTALHLAVLNGHEPCVKALLYYSEQAHFRLDYDAVNCNGDTAMHLAARWGYTNIVQLLLQWEVDCRIFNKHKQTAADVAQNVKISQLISKFSDTEEKRNLRERLGSSRFWTGLTRQLSLKRRPIQSS